ncbi:CAP domain-containing protein [Streptomyces barringtoniae]|uniref:CAP domain-containing protein n=1 Tax=Streptomyces barringtoniae TaxID=2892029 RepID=UPI001E424D37|nr:CAP domain-containing protein [Streptomyces barringtoniae]MCC5473608.1 CAP domain-containing protein [Streptomyces barringtoniae]
MAKHRKSQQYRRIVVAAVAIGTVGVPSVALACSDWPYGGKDRADVAATSTPGQPQHHGHRHHHHHHRNDHHHAGTPQATASPRHRPTAHPSTSTKTTAPTPRTTAAPSTSKPAPTATASSVTARVVQLVNAERAKVGCRPLTVNAKLAKAAQAHSADMAAHQNMSHTGSDGSSPGDRITRAGYSWSSYGENVAYGYATPDQVMTGWMNSPGHRANILDCSFKEIGVGLAQPGSYWTQDFGAAR